MLPYLFYFILFRFLFALRSAVPVGRSVMIKKVSHAHASTVRKLTQVLKQFDICEYCISPWHRYNDYRESIE